MNKKTGIIKDQRLFNHRIEQASPENPGRLKNLYLTLANPTYGDKLAGFSPREAGSREIERIHSKFYLDQIRAHALATDPFSYDRDTYLMDESIYTAQLAAGGCLELADRIMNSEIKNGFALVRPPGHHAEPGRGMGFCIFNNIAITAAYLQKTYGLKRILIFDFDVHHGNGTQDIFYDSSQVLTVSMHQNNLFPFTGKIDELGKDQGVGYNLNLPLFSQFGDLEYTYLTGKVMGHITEQFMPQIILVSAGFDAHVDETISDTTLTTKWFGSVTTMLKKLAYDACDERLLFILEGGYNPISLEASVLTVIDALLEAKLSIVGIPESERAKRLLENHPLHKFWHLS
ncbi:MAG: histone deacetylase [Deltaproteobacteria bacterium]|nr:histone deacetylase [Candidatus Tharpella aukensis]